MDTRTDCFCRYRTKYERNKLMDYGRLFLLAYISLICICFTFYNITSNTALFLIGVGLIMCSVIFFSTDKAFLLMSSLLPSLMMIKIKNNTFAFYGLFLLAIEFKFFLAQFYRRHIIEVPFVLIFFALMCMITCALYYELSMLSTLVRTIAFFLFIYNFLHEYRSREFFSKILYFYVFGCILSVLCGLIYYVAIGMNIFNGDFRGINNDRNYFAAIISSGISISLYSLINKCNNKYFFLISLFALLFGGIITGSRTFVLSITIVFICTFIFSFNRKTFFWFCVIALLLLIIYSFLSVVIDKIILTITKRFLEDNVSDGNGRTIAWAFYLNKSISSLKSFMFGNGSAVKFVESGEFFIVEHSTVVQAIFTYGYITTILYCLIVRSIYKRIKIDRFKFANIIPLAALLFCYFTVSAFLSDNFNFGIVIMLVVLSNPCEEQVSHEMIGVEI